MKKSFYLEIINKFQNSAIKKNGQKICTKDDTQMKNKSMQSCMELPITNEMQIQKITNNSTHFT